MSLKKDQEVLLKRQVYEMTKARTRPGAMREHPLLRKTKLTGGVASWLGICESRRAGGIMADATTALQLARVRELLTGYQYQIEGKWFYQQDLQLDGFAFIRCRFDNCKLTVRRGDFVLDHCALTGNFVWFNDDALTALRFYNIFSNPPQGFPDYIRPQQNADGTISVNKLNNE